ncbi:hypothetical protein MP228_008436 [Amoeboaphelidium protococcarum]|nr:hypothetical protein MP228_008436 [Amoeboaphelidium protococcarum]
MSRDQGQDHYYSSIPLQQDADQASSQQGLVQNYNPFDSNDVQSALLFNPFTQSTDINQNNNEKSVSSGDSTSSSATRFNEETRLDSNANANRRDQDQSSIVSSGSKSVNARKKYSLQHERSYSQESFQALLNRRRSTLNDDNLVDVPLGGGAKRSQSMKQYGSATKSNQFGVNQDSHAALCKKYLYQSRLPRSTLSLINLLFASIMACNVYATSSVARFMPQHLQSNWTLHSVTGMFGMMMAASFVMFSVMTMVIGRRAWSLSKVNVRKAGSFFVRCMCLIALLSGALALVPGAIWNNTVAANGGQIYDSKSFNILFMLVRPIVAGLLNGVALAIVIFAVIFNFNGSLNNQMSDFMKSIIEPESTTDNAFMNALARNLAFSVWRFFILGFCVLPQILVESIRLIIVTSSSSKTQEEGNRQYENVLLIVVGAVSIFLSAVIYGIDLKRAIDHSNDVVSEIELADLRDEARNTYGRGSASERFASGQVSFAKIWKFVMSYGFSLSGWILYFVVFALSLGVHATSWYLNQVMDDMLYFSKVGRILAYLSLVVFACFCSFLFVFIRSRSESRMSVQQVCAKNEEEYIAEIKTQSKQASVMHSLAQYQIIFSISGILAVIFGSYVIPNGGSVVFTYFAMIITLSLGIYPALCSFIGSIAGTEGSIAIYRFRDQFSSNTVTSTDFAIRARNLKSQLFSSFMAVLAISVCAFLAAGVSCPYLFQFSKWSSIELHNKGIWVGSSSIDHQTTLKSTMFLANNNGYQNTYHANGNLSIQQNNNNDTDWYNAGQVNSGVPSLFNYATNSPVSSSAVLNANQLQFTGTYAIGWLLLAVYYVIALACLWMLIYFILKSRERLCAKVEQLRINSVSAPGRGGY